MSTAPWILCLPALLSLVACGGKGPAGSCPDGSNPTTWYADADGDGFGDQVGVDACTAPIGHIAISGDCDDSSPLANPNGTEVCDDDNVDEDCDGQADNDDPDGAQGAVDGWPDGDSDGFGDASSAPSSYCDILPGTALSADDCDDSDPATFPGAAFIEDPSACMEDADGDGWGSAAPGGAALAGTDCNDQNATAWPGAREILVDGVDQDCDGLDAFGLFDDFELSQPDPAVWQQVLGDAVVGTDPVAQGSYSLTLSGGGATADTVAVDTTICPDLTWWYLGKRGPENPDANEWLTVSFYDGSSWVEIDAWEGGGGDASFAFRSGLITDVTARHSAFQLRLDRFGGTSGTDDFHIDDFFVGCPGPDGDGDGVPERFDCNDFDANHWSDCATCVDGDGDDYGAGCDLGPDCDDTDPTVNPQAPDPVGDGLDTNCDGSDGVRLYDDFELGIPSPNTWVAVAGDAVVQSTYAGAGAFALNLGGAGGTAESVRIDTTSCQGLFWTYLGKRGPDSPETADGLNLEYWDGANWQLIDRWAGDGSTDPGFALRFGTVTAPSAFHSSFGIRLVSNGSGTGFDDFYVDELSVGCADDGDGDGVVDALDCDLASPAHWADCGLCVDGDGDDYGAACDLGPDCDDADAAVSPEALEIGGNGVDEDCDGYDVEALADDFELGGLRPTVWAATSGGVGVQDVDVAAGTWALEIDALDGAATTWTLDASGCTDLWFSAAVKRVGAPALGDDLILSYDDGGGWVEFARVSGDGTSDAAFVPVQLTLADPAALWSGLRVELAASAAGGGLGSFAVDDFVVACGADGDGDGFPEFDDCDDTAPQHWADCGLCIDTDADGYGTACDLGGDCDDLNPTVNPGAADPVGDGLDTNCDGMDGVALFDDFELGAINPSVFASISGDADVQAAYTGNGAWALHLGGGGGVATTVNVDLSGCSQIRYAWLGKRGPDQPENGDDVAIEYSTPAGWVLADTWVGGATDPAFTLREGILSDPAALWAGFALRLTSSGTGAGLDDYFIDDFEVGCFVDGDGDGIPFEDDCDDTDPLHWFDCGLCSDADGDGYGGSCDLGPDCDDTDPAVYPAAADAPGDGLDLNCDGADGVELFDDFELGVVDPSTFLSLDGDGDVQSAYAAAGVYGLRMGGGIATATSVVVNTSACDLLVWSYEGKRGPEAPDLSDFLKLEYWNGASWTTTDTWSGDGTVDGGFALRAGVITDPSALRADFQVRLFSDGSGPGTDEYYVDDFLVFCDSDGDGDGVVSGLDCDDADPAHWSDCGLCLDADADDHGPGCDLGPDCDDADPTVFPGAPDPLGDGLDSNCDGSDGVMIRDDFELGMVDPNAFVSLTGDGEVQNTTVGFGAWSLRMGGGIATAETVTADVTTCPTLVWGYWGKRGPETPDPGDLLSLDWWDGSTWVTEDLWAGDGTLDPGFELRWGVISNPAAYHGLFKARLFSDGTAVGNDDYYVDDFLVGCDDAIDTDGDGVIDVFDCAVADPWHWTDCGLCVDADADGYGASCDLGDDCDDLDPNTNPLGVDLGLDGQDQDCDGIDGPPLLFDTFDLGVPDPAVWASVSGDAGALSTQFYSGGWSLNLGGGGGQAQTVTVDTTGCYSVAWSYQGKQGPDNPELGDDLDLAFDGGAGLVLWDSWLGGNATGGFVHRFGVITDPAAISPTLSIQLSTIGTGVGFDDFFVDDFALGCAP